MTALILDEGGVMQAGAQLIANGVQGVSVQTATLAPALAPAPAGMDEVSAAASSGHAAYTSAWQVINMFMNQEIVRLGGAFFESVAAYRASDTAGAASL